MVFLPPAPVGTVTLHGIPHRKALPEGLDVLLQQFLALFRRADVLILQAEPVLLVLLGHLFRGLPLRQHGQVGELVLLALHQERHRHESPYIIVPALGGRQPQILHAVVVKDAARQLVTHEYRTQHRKQVVGRQVLLRHPALVELQIELRIVVLPPRELRTDGHLLDAAVGKQQLLHLLRPAPQLVVVVAVHLHAEAAGTLPHVVAEALVLQPVHAPASTAQGQRLAHHVRLQHIGKARMAVLLLEEHLDACPARIVHRCLELAYLLEPAQVGLHLLDQHVHLLQRTAVGQGGVDIQHHLALVTVEVAAVVHLLGKETERTAQHLVHYRLDVFPAGRIVENLVIPLCPCPLLLRVLYPLREHEHRKSETEHQQKESDRPIAAQQHDHPPVKAGEMHGPPLHPQPRMRRLSPLQTGFLYHRRHEEQGH